MRWRTRCSPSWRRSRRCSKKHPRSSSAISLTGGGALLGGLRELIHRTLSINCVLAKDAVHCVAKGTGLAFQKINNLLDGFEGVTIYKYQ